MLKKGIECFRTNTNMKMEMPSGIPDLYRLFLKCYEVGSNSLAISLLKYKNEFIQFTCINYKNTLVDEKYENSIANLFSIEELKSELELYSIQKEEHHKLGFIKIGYFDISDIILLKLDNDEIWKFNGDWNVPKPSVEKLSNNIFEFLACCYETTIEMNLMVRKINMDHILKKWGEDFWRVRGNDIT